MVGIEEYLREHVGWETVVIIYCMSWELVVLKEKHPN